MELIRGRTSQIIPVRIVDSNGLPKTGLVFNTSGLSAVYQRELDAAPTTITLATMTAGTWATGGFIELNSTSMPGVYAVGIPNAAISAADASTWSVIQFVGTVAANLYAQPIRIDLVAVNVQDSVRYGLTALPNANAEAAGGLYTRGTGAGQINQDANGRVDTNTKTWIGGAIPAVNVTGVPKVDVLDWLGATVATPATAGVPDVNTKNLGGTAQTGRDIGASVLLSSGTGTGQLDFTSGVVKSNLVQILASAITGTAANIVAAFTKLFNVVTPVFDMTSIIQTGDSYSRIGAAGAGLTALGDTRIANLDATLSSRLAPTTAGRTLDVAATGEAGLDFDNIKAATAPTTLTNITVPVVTTTTTATNVTNDVGITQAGADKVWASAARTLTAFSFTVNATITGIAAGIIAAASFASGALDAVWSTAIRTITGGTVTTATNLTNAPTVGDFTATMKTSLNDATPSVTVSDKTGFSLSAAGISAIWANASRTLTGFGTLVSDIWANVTRTITGGAIDTNNDKTGYALSGAGVTAVQSGLGTSANQTTINNNVLAIPTNPLLANDSRLNYLDASIASRLATSNLVVASGTAQGGGASTITLAAGASATNDLYNGQTVFIPGGTGAGQIGSISDYNGNTKVATVATAWAIPPDPTSTYVLLAMGSSAGGGSPITVADIWNAINASYAVPGSQSALLASIKSDTSKIGDGNLVINSPVDPDTGLTTLVRGSSYMLNDNRAIYYTIDSFPDLTIGQPAFWHAQKINRLGAETVEGIITAAKRVRFEFEAAETLYLAGGSFSLSLDSANSNPLRTANNTLIILDS